MAERAEISVKGTVQGVGFRPYVFGLAKSLGINGYVANTAGGVLIDAEGDAIAEFLRRLPEEAPPLSRIENITVSTRALCGYSEFRIIVSRDDGDENPFTLVSPDVSICDDCLDELLDPADRRYLYPFINCTNCGPRYTITKAVPYDRPNTTMRDFIMCKECLREYEDPSHRRFHAQPNACPECGPQVEFKIQDSRFKANETENPIAAAVRLLKEGAIVAIKGLGGFHLACDASNEEAVMKLRERKRKSNKPFALMAPDARTVGSFCEVSEEEQGQLLSRNRPIVLLGRKVAAERRLSAALSPNNRRLGFMLPYTPLHYLLFYYPLSAPGQAGIDISRRPTKEQVDTSYRRKPVSRPLGFRVRHGMTDSVFVSLTDGKENNFDALVMTSGNISEEPIVADNHEAIERLSGLADAFLLHNRDIFMRVDDSVVRVISNDSRVPLFIRRSRGYAPQAVQLGEDGPEVLGCGADIKNTFTLTKGRFAIPGQHVGDMENYETLRFFEESLENIKRVYRVKPVAVAHDLHPGYLSTQWALRQDLPKFGVQHHYAHVGSVMAEKGLKGEVIGIAFDGTGYGADGNLWGSEFLIAGPSSFERAGHFRYMRLPGGQAAIREPWRTATGCIRDASEGGIIRCLDSIGFSDRYGRYAIDNIMKVIDSTEFSPVSCGAGRLFDAVASIVGICDRNTYEGEAASALEALISGESDEDYPVEISQDYPAVVDFSRTILGITDDVSKGVNRALISVKFHNTVANVILKIALRIGRSHGLTDVILSGGTFQNVYLLNRSMRLLAGEGMNVFINEKVPCNDGGISLGQAFLCRESIRSGL